MPRVRPEPILIAAAIALRVAAVLVLQSHLIPRSTYEHGTIAANLLAGKGFSTRFLGSEGPTSQQAPVYPLFVALAYAVGGIETPGSLLLLELGQAVLGGLLVAAIMALAREIAPGKPLIAMASGFLVAVHPTLVYASTHVQVAGLAALLLTYVLVRSARTGRTGRVRDAAAAGLVLALLVLTDPILGLVAPACGWMIVQSQGFRRGLKLTAIAAIVAMTWLTPWTLRNHSVHGEFVAVKSTFGYAFWQGNCSLSEGTDKVVRQSIERAIQTRGQTNLSGWNKALWLARHEAGYIDDIALSKADYEQLGKLTEPARSRLLFRRALVDLKADPMRYPKLCVRRLRYFLLFDETNPKTRSLIYRVSHLGLSGLALLGLLSMPNDLRRKLAPTMLAAGLIALFHTLTIVSARFHIPIEPLLALWASAPLARLRRSPLGSSAPAAGDVERVWIHDRFSVIPCTISRAFPAVYELECQNRPTNHTPEPHHGHALPDVAHQARTRW